MKVHRLIVLMAKGWCKVVCLVSFSLLSVISNHASAQNAGGNNKEDEEGEIPQLEIVFSSGPVAYGSPRPLLNRVLEGLNQSNKGNKLVVLDSEAINIDNARLRSFDFENCYNDRDSLASLLGVNKNRLKAVRYLKEKGVVEILTRKQYRKYRKEGKPDDNWQLLKR